MKFAFRSLNKHVRNGSICGMTGLYWYSKLTAFKWSVKANQPVATAEECYSRFPCGYMSTEQFGIITVLESDIKPRSDPAVLGLYLLNDQTSKRKSQSHEIRCSHDRIVQKFDSRLCRNAAAKSVKLQNAQTILNLYIAASRLRETGW